MASIGLSGFDKKKELNYEKGHLRDEALKYYEDVVLIDPRQVIYKFIRGEKKPQIIYKGRNLASLDSLIVRSSKGCALSVAILVRSLFACGCDIFDPVDRFAAGRSTKVLSTLERFQKQVGTNTYFAFTPSKAIELLQDLDQEKRFPLLTKPVEGKQGQGIITLKSLEDGLDHVNTFFGDQTYIDEPLCLQDFETFKHEYRVVVVDGVALGAAEKIRKNGPEDEILIKADVPDILEAAANNVNNVGVIGVDVAVDARGWVHIVEANRSPQWHEFEEATGINISEYIIKRARERLNQK